MVINIILFFILLVVVLSLLFYKFVFLRDPERKIPAGNNIVSPADGGVIKIVRLDKAAGMGIKKGLIGRIKTLVPSNCRDGYLVTIMMDLFNVHVQRAPLEGIVLSVNHFAGSFNNAVYGDRFENGLWNEKNEIVIENDKIGKFKVIQIAGFLARRIECFVRKKEKINKGQKIGRILLGSQVSLILPRNLRLLVEEGDKVRAGETVLGEF